MAIDSDTLRRKVGASSTVSAEDLDALINAAGDLLIGYVGDAEVPDTVLDRAHLAVAVEMYHQDKAPNGILNQQYDNGDGSVAVRIGRDPLTPAYPLLRQWVSGKFYCA